MGSTPFDESIQDQTVSASHISSLEKYCHKIDSNGLVRKRTQDDFEGIAIHESGSNIQKMLKTAYGRSQSLDAFGRLRTSLPIDVFDNKNISSKNEDLFDEVVSGTASITFDRTKASVDLVISGANGDRALRQTKYLTYIPGKSQLIEMTGFLLDKPIDQVAVVRRSSVSGVVVDYKTPQAEWNRNTVDAVDSPTNRCNVVVDFNKAQIFHIDFQWLALGNSRHAIMCSKGNLIEIHEIENPNSDTVPYMRTPSLPMRYELVSDGTYAYGRIGYFDDSDGLFIEARSLVANGPFTLREICCSCANEAGSKPTGLIFHANTRGTAITANTTGVNVLAIKLKDTFLLSPNRKTALLAEVTNFSVSQNTYFEIYKVTDYSADTSTWLSMNDRSGCEVARGSGIDITVTRQILLDSSIVIAGGSGGSARAGAVESQKPLDILDENLIIKQSYASNKSQIFLIRAFTFTSTSVVHSAISVVEFE